jgi:hypothetical protein
MQHCKLGELRIATMASRRLKPQEVLRALWSHAETTDVEITTRPAVRYFSGFVGGSGDEFQVTTEPDHRRTIVFLPGEDYSESFPIDSWILSFVCPSCGN